MSRNRSLGTLTIDLVAKVGGFVAGLTVAERESDKRAKEIQQQWQRAGRRIGRIMVQVGAAVSAASLLIARGMKSSIDRMNELYVSAQRAGTSSEFFSALTYAADQNSVSVQSLEAAFKTLNDRMGRAAQGSARQVRAFKTLGLEIKDLDGNLREGSEVLLEFAEIWKREGGSPEVMALGTQVFGGAMQQIIPLLNNGRDGIEDLMEKARELGIVFTDESGAAADQFNSDLASLRQSIGGVYQSLAEDLLPDLVVFTNQLVESAKETKNLSAAKDVMRTAFELFQIGLSAANILWQTFRGTLRIVTQGVISLATSLSGLGKILANLNIRDAVNGNLRRAAQEATATFNREWRMFEAEAVSTATKSNAAIWGSVENISNVWSGAYRKQSEGVSEVTEGVREQKIQIEDTSRAGSRASDRASSEARRRLQELERLKKAYDDQFESFERTIFMLGREGEEASMLWETSRGRFKDYSEEQKQALLLAARVTDTAKRAYDQETKAREEAARALRDQAEEMKRVNETYARYISDVAFELTLLGRTRDEQERLNILRQVGIEQTSEAGRILSESLKVYQRQREAVEQQVEAMDTLRSSISDAFSSWVSGTSSFKDAFLGALDSINQRIMEMISDNFVQKIFGQFGSADGAGSGFFGKLFGVNQDPTLPDGAATVTPFSPEVIARLESEAQAMTEGVINIHQEGMLQIIQAVNAASSSAVGTMGTVGSETMGSVDSTASHAVSELTSTSQKAVGWFSRLFSMFSGGGAGGGMGSWITTILGAFGGGRAAGGSVNPGMFYRVNEIRPEVLSVGNEDYLMMGNRGGRVHNRSASVGGMQMVNNFTIQGRIDRRTEAQIAMAVGQRAQVAETRYR